MTEHQVGAPPATSKPTPPDSPHLLALQALLKATREQLAQAKAERDQAVLTAAVYRRRVQRAEKWYGPTSDVSGLHERNK